MVVLLSSEPCMAKEKVKLCRHEKGQLLFFLSLGFHMAFTLIFLTALPLTPQAPCWSIVTQRRKIGDCSISQSIFMPEA